MVKPDDTLCTYCGMTCAQGEYHPYGVCLMVKACRNTETVQANLAAMREHFQAEVRKDDEALIRQMLEALTAPVDGEALHALHMSAIAAARARLFDSGLSTLTERGAKAWAGVDPQKLREGGAP